MMNMLEQLQELLLYIIRSLTQEYTLLPIFTFALLQLCVAGGVLREGCPPRAQTSSRTGPWARRTSARLMRFLQSAQAAATGQGGLLVRRLPAQAHKYASSSELGPC